MQEKRVDCKQCVLHSKMPEVTVNERGICNVCEGYEKFKNHEPRAKKFLVEEMENLFDKARKSDRPYQVGVLFSGGKDSTILLKIATEKYKLRTLAIAVMHPLVNETASANMNSVTSKLGVDLIKIYPDENIYKKVMKHGILNGPKYGLGEFFGCEICSFFHFWSSIRYAMKMDIPILLEGSDSSQTGEITFWQAERVQADAKKGKKPFGRVHDLLADALDDDYKGIYAYDEKEITEGKYPTVISPFTFTDYDYRENFKVIEGMGLEAKKFRSIFTNCDATPFFSYFTVKRFDCVSYIRHYATEVRRGYPNLMQRSLDDKTTGDALTKEVVEDLMGEYKAVVLYVGENKLDESNITEAEKEKIIAMAPTYMKIFGEGVCDVFLKDVLQIHRYAEFFDVNLEEALTPSQE